MQSGRQLSLLLPDEDGPFQSSPAQCRAGDAASAPRPASHRRFNPRPLNAERATERNPVSRRSRRVSILARSMQSGRRPLPMASAARTKFQSSPAQCRAGDIAAAKGTLRDCLFQSSPAQCRAGDLANRHAPVVPEVSILARSMQSGRHRPAPSCAAPRRFNPRPLNAERATASATRL